MTAAGGQAVGTDPAPRSAFLVHLDQFDGPFDLLLGLIAKHQLDVTELGLSQVTDDFIAHLKAAGSGWDLDQTTEFLVVAATLLDLKAARLLPSAEVEDEEDLALLEARDLLFARLLQYRAYKQAAAVFAARMREEALRHPRAVVLEERFAGLLPEVLLGFGPHEFAAFAARTLAPRAEPVVSIAHIHAPRVSVRDQAELMLLRLSSAGRTSFRRLIEDCSDTLTVVARFLALLELFRDGSVSFEQVDPLGELHVSWTGATAEVELAADFGEEYDAEPVGDDQLDEIIPAGSEPTGLPEADVQ